MVNELNYDHWRSLYNDRLESLKKRKVIITYSGGKDSSVVLYLINRAASDFGFEFEVHGGVFPHHVLTPSERNRLDKFWDGEKVEINWHVIPETDDRLEKALADGISPCLICNRAKKAALVKYFSEQAVEEGRITFVISYSLWDLVSASVEHLLGAKYRSGKVDLKFKSKSADERFQETAQRYYSWLDVGERVSIFKPLIRFNDESINDFLHEHSIPVTTTSCSYKQYRPKRLFAQYYEMMGLSFDFDSVFNFAKSCMELPERSFFENREARDYFKELF